MVVSRGLRLVDWPPMPRFAVSAVVAIAVLAISTPILALNEPAVVAMRTQSYQIANNTDSQKITEFLSKDGQLLLPFLELICKTEQVVDELIDEHTLVISSWSHSTKKRPVFQMICHRICFKATLGIETVVRFAALV